MEEDYSFNDPKDSYVESNVEAFVVTDPGYCTVKRLKPNSRNILKMRKLDVYTTPIGRGSFIRNAETGMPYREKSGTFDEYMYFKVALSTGELKSKNGSNILFYDSPKQYEEHLNGIVSDEIREAWEERRNSYVSKKRSL
jgi:hypothetical protein